MHRVALSAGDLSLDLAPALGGSVASFRLAQLDLFRPLPADETHAVRSGMFPMVPFANCIRDNSFDLDGENYRVTPNMEGSPLNFHGSGWLLPWTLTEQDASRAVLRLDGAKVDDAYTFDAQQVFDLTEAGLAVELSVTNRAARRLPFSFGQHPWFPRHGATHLRFAANGLWTEGTNGVAGVLTNVPVNCDYAVWRQPPLSRQNNCYAGWDGTAHIAWPERRIGLSMRADPLFSHLMFHVPPSGEPVFCAEPQTNAPCGFDGLESGSAQGGVFILDPGASIVGTIHFRPIRETAFSQFWRDR